MATRYAFASKKAHRKSQRAGFHSRARGRESAVMTVTPWERKKAKYVHEGKSWATEGVTSPWRVAHSTQ